MKKIIRLNESDLTRIVRRVIKEEQMTKQMLMAKATDCWDPKKYPQIASLMKVYGWGLFTVAAAASTYFSAGISGGITVTAGLLGAGKTVEELIKVIESNSSFKAELSVFYDCMFGL